MRPFRVFFVATVAVLLVAPPIVAGAQTAPPDPSPPSTTASTQAVPCEDPFTDVACGQAFFDEITWLVRNGIATGYDDGTFRPASPVTRQAMAAFLWRLEGSPAGPFPDPAYSDVPLDHPFHTAIAWMTAEGITTGYPDNTFRPRGDVSRQAMAAFLFRLEGPPAGPFPDPGYADVPSGHPFHTAISWMADTGITTGYDDNTFRPTEIVPRRGMAAFLFRLSVFRDLHVETADRCEFLDPAHCLLVWPSNHFTTPDASTDTGLRLNLQDASLPAPTGGVAAGAVELNRNDGFSPGTAVMTQVPGLDLDQTDAPPLTDLAESLETDAPTVIIDADTGARHLIWAELDPGASAEDQVLMLRAGVNFEEGHRYIAALRNLKDAAGEVIEPNDIFRAYRDDIVTGIPSLEDRRPAMDEIFQTLDDAGVERGDLYLAWDFTIASERNLSERMLHIRDDAFADLGTVAPGFTVTDVTDMTPAEDDDIARVVEGTVDVPLYLTGDGEPGSSFNWGADGLPQRNGTFLASFTCQIPHSATGEAPARISLYGHGLLGGRDEIDAGNVEDFSNEHNIVFCATDWIGMSEGDLLNVIAILQDLSKFHTLADRVQQGILNTLFLGRAMKHVNGFATDDAFQDAGGDPLLDNSNLYFDGNSQGAIIGGAATAVAQDWTRAVLGVPGMNYSLLLRRSSDWPVYESILQQNYPDRLDQNVGLSIIQLLWDRAESNGYAHHMTDDPYANTPAHQVLLHVAYGDFQVSMWSAEIEARTIGASIRQPALAPGRHPDTNPFVGLPTVPGNGFPGSVLVYWDSGTPPPPTTATHPTSGSDPHSRPRAQPSARIQKSAFFAGLYVDVCAGLPCLAP